MLDANQIKKLENIYKTSIIASNEDAIYPDLVSVIMPSYNNEKWLTISINSVLSQKKVNIELIIVDDGSTDGSIDIAIDFAKKYNNVRVIPLLMNFGCYYARNIGIINSSGKYIITHDSDDIADPYMIFKQLQNLKSNKKIACLCKLRRWNSDFTKQVGDLKYGENTLLWDKSIIKTIGYYDSVRFSGDTEFRKRIIKVYNEDSITYLNEELYAVRTIEHSLTTSTGESNLIKKVNGNYEFTFSDARRTYLHSFTDWHKNITSKTARVSFPLFHRKFKLGSDLQNASPVLNQKRIGMLATYPARFNVLKQVIQSIIPQVDDLFIYLNEYTKIPDYLNSPKIHAILGKDALGDLKDNGKFYSIPKDKNCYIFTFDDDIIYPKDYVTRMIYYIEIFNRICIVGVHGTIYPKKYINYNDKKTFCFFEKTSGHFVDLLGTGTTAWHNSTIDISIDSFKSQGQCDLYFAENAFKNNIPLFCIPHKENWLNKAIIDDKKSIYYNTKYNSDSFFNIYNNTLKNYVDSALRNFFEYKLINSFSKNTIKSLNIDIDLDLDNVNNKSYNLEIKTRRTIINLFNINIPFNSSFNNFDVIIYGKNTYENIDNTLRSLALQKIGHYNIDITIADLGSTDRTLEKIANMNIINSAKLIAFNNVDTEHALRVCMQQSINKNNFSIYIKMGTKLANDFLLNIYNILKTLPKNTKVISDNHILRDSNYFSVKNSNLNFCLANFSSNLSDNIIIYKL